MVDPDLIDFLMHDSASKHRVDIQTNLKIF